MDNLIIVGIYPDQIPSYESTDKSSLSILKDEINDLLPNEVALHILPFYETCGDGGFAISNWDVVDDTFGAWSDIESIANERMVIIDGVFNHIGMEHKLVKLLIEDPQTYAPLFHVNPYEGINSPRGVTSNYDMDTTRGIIRVRKTHTNAALDVNLEHHYIQGYINDFLKASSKRNIYGIRLDAVAYYKKGTQIRHNKGSYQLAETIARIAKKHKLNVIAQIDCDVDGRKYYSKTDFSDVAIYDFGYSAALSLAFFEGQPQALVQFLQINQNVKRPLVRAPRTHDGILLRTRNLTPNQIDRLIAEAGKIGISVREANGIPYELNCSMPFLLQQISSSKFHTLLEMTIMITGILNSIPYFYFPYMVGYIPEDHLGIDKLNKRFDKEDCRTLNRIPIYNWDQLKTGVFVKNRLPYIFKILTEIHNMYGEDLIKHEASFSVSKNRLMMIETANGAVNGIFNFSDSPCNMDLKKIPCDYLVYENCSSNDTIESYGYYIWIKPKQILQTGY